MHERPAWLDVGKVPGLDGLRAVSILLVLLAHLRGVPRALRDALAPFDLGHMGVGIFFSISGFLITLLMLREYKVRGSVSRRNFYVRRAFRILPVYLLFILVLAGFVAVGRLEILGRDWAMLLTFTANLFDKKPGVITHIWSLSLEEQFYLVWPTTFLALGVSRAIRWLPRYFLIAPVLRVAAYVLAPEWTAFRWGSLIAAEEIAFGCLLALWLFEDDLRVKLDFLRGKEGLVGGCGALILIVSYRYIAGIQGVSLVIRPAFQALAAGMLVYAAAFNSSSGVLSLLRSRVFVWIGVLSYSIYIWQQLVFALVRSFPANVVLIIVVGATSYYLIERPFLRLKRRFGDFD